jgi:hypothetical protein
VINTESVTKIIVNNKYFPTNGKVVLLAGIISIEKGKINYYLGFPQNETSNRKNIVKATKIFIESETFSPDSDGR